MIIKLTAIPKSARTVDRMLAIPDEYYLLRGKGTLVGSWRYMSSVVNEALAFFKFRVLKRVLSMMGRSE